MQNDAMKNASVFISDKDFKFLEQLARSPKKLNQKLQQASKSLENKIKKS